MSFQGQLDMAWQLGDVKLAAVICNNVLRELGVSIRHLEVVTEGRTLWMLVNGTTRHRIDQRRLTVANLRRSVTEYRRTQEAAKPMDDTIEDARMAFGEAYTDYLATRANYFKLMVERIHTLITVECFTLHEAVTTLRGEGARLSDLQDALREQVVDLRDRFHQADPATESSASAEYLDWYKIRKQLKPVIEQAITDETAATRARQTR